jgi:hypothetical protein
MSMSRNVVLLAGAYLALGVISPSATAESTNSDTATTTRLAYFQVFKDPMDATCPNPKRRKVKTSSGYKWRWVC